MDLPPSRYYGLVMLKFLFFILGFLVSIQLMILSLKLLNANIVEQILIATSNPFIGLFIGILITALIHSSSTITSMLVGIVASGTVSLESAVYMVMGANIGTTVTSTMVSFGYANRKKEFRKAIAAATVHDFFNILTAFILFPLEYYFGLLSNLAKNITSIISTNNSFGFSTFFGGLLGFIDPIAYFILENLNKNEFLGLLIGVIGLYLSIKFISATIQNVILQNSPNLLERYLFGTPFQSLLCGFLATTFAQSSTLVTSLVVPFVANNKLSVKQIFPFIMGANIGTTITAVIASISKSDAALAIALTHVLFNLIGTLLFFPIPQIRAIPVSIARGLGKATLRNRLVGLAYIILVFFLVPFVLIFFNKDKIKIKEYAYTEQNNELVINSPSTASFITKTSSNSRQRFFYLQTNLSNKKLSELGQSNEITVKKANEVIFLNKQAFQLKPKGTCWSDEDMKGQYEMCVEKEIKKFQLSQNLFFDKCLIYSKKYSNADIKYSHRLYLAVKEKIIIKHEIFDDKGKLVAKEELVSILN
jgi:sodium-dependent phosphate cotransporter